MPTARIAPENGATIIIVPDQENRGELVIFPEADPNIFANGLILIAMQNQLPIQAQMVEVAQGDSCNIYTSENVELARVEVFKGPNNLPMIHTPENIDELGKPRFYPIAEGYFQGVMIPNLLYPVATVWSHDS